MSVSETIFSRFEATIEATQSQADGGRMVVRGIANTFRVMHSGRMFHPRAFARQMQASGGRVNLPLLAMHGMTFSETYPNVGKVSAIGIEPGRGLVFDGWVGAGTELMDETRKLVNAGVLSGISVGAVVAPDARRLVNRDDADIDPLIAQQMDAQGAKRALVFFDAELVEISLVDVPDDRDARLAARAAQRRVADLERQLSGKPRPGGIEDGFIAEEAALHECQDGSIDGSEVDRVADALDGMADAIQADFITKLEAFAPTASFAGYKLASAASALRAAAESDRETQIVSLCESILLTLECLADGGEYAEALENMRGGCGHESGAAVGVAPSGISRSAVDRIGQLFS